jgi:hypothetical protein
MVVTVTVTIAVLVPFAGIVDGFAVTVSLFAGMA